MLDERIRVFVEEHRPRLEDADGQLFQVGLQEVWYYRQFLDVIVDRFRVENTEGLDLVTTLMAMSFTSTNEERLVVVHKSMKSEVRLHLEIESFYLFAKILLDKAARYFEWFVTRIPQPKRWAISSHDDLCRNLNRYAVAHGLALDPGWEAAALEMRLRVSDFRDKHVAHDQSPRRTRNTSWDNGQPARMTVTRIFREPKDKEASTADLPELLARLDNYLDGFLAVIRDNFARAADLRLAGRHAGAR